MNNYQNNLKKRDTRDNKDIGEQSEQFDIFHIDDKIKKNIKNESKRIIHYKQELENLINLYLNYQKETNISDKKKKELINKIELLKQKINDIENDISLAEYICVSTPILEKYKKLIQTPVKVSFFNTSNKKENTINNMENDKYELLDEFYDIARKYIHIKSYKKETTQKYICCCGNQNNYTETHNKIICNECSNVHSIQSIQTSFKDIDRVNLSQKYKYKKKVHFRDTVNQYQGKQNKRINPDIFLILEEQFKIHNLVNLDGKNNSDKYTNITKEHIYMFLFETNNSNYYEDINMIHTYFTGIPCPDISNVEYLLYEDFDKVVDAYESLEDIDRIHFLNGQYILYQLLRRRKVKVKESDFDILKTRERLVEHDEIYQKICMKLEWTFLPTV
jgi:hypothetical protein